MTSGVCKYEPASDSASDSASDFASDFASDSALASYDRGREGKGMSLS